MAQTIMGQVLLDQYRVDAFIAAGGMGAVYRVWDLKRQVPLAMKVLHADLAEDPHIFKRFKREANALKKLAHPNIVPFYGLYQTLDFAFLLEGYVDGPTLKEVLKRKGRLSVEEALTVLKGVSAALNYAHAHGVVHCDVKPGNVMIDRGGRVYLTDFGIARHAESTTTTFGFAGTAAYMAPEQVKGDIVTPATDVYALGVMAYELLAGRRPFTGEEEGTAGTATRAERLRMAHLKLAPPDPREFNPDLPEGMAKVLLRALAKQPEERYEDAWAFFEALCAGKGVSSSDVADRVPFSLVSELVETQSAPLSSKSAKTVTGAVGDEQVAVRQKAGFARWGWLIGIVVTVVVAAGALVFGMGREGTSRASGEPAGAQANAESTISGHVAGLPLTTTFTPTPSPTATFTPSPTPTRVPPTPTPRRASLWERLGYDLAFVVVP